MTTLYKPVLIESAEQAEALPDGTLAHGHWPDRQYGDGLVKKIGGAWMPRSVTGIGLAPSEALIGWSALVPIEAEEEHTIWRTYEGGANGIGTPVPSDYPFPDLAPGEAVHSRLVTPWEEA